MAESGGFEPPNQFPSYPLSKRALSATQPTLHSLKLFFLEKNAQKTMSLKAKRTPTMTWLHKNFKGKLFKKKKRQDLKKTYKPQTIYSIEELFSNFTKVVFSMKLTSYNLFVYLFTLWFSSSCTHQTQTKTNSASPQKMTAMVASAHPAATEAGLTMLKKGGNAIDAFVASSFVLSVTTPQSTGIGGGGFLLYYNNQNKKVSAYDFRERAPALATENMFVDKQNRKKPFRYQDTLVENSSLNGPLSIGTPGLVAGLWETHQKFGSLPWDVLLEPAKKIAEEGFIIDRKLASALKKRAKILAAFPSSKKIFFKNNKPLELGQILVQKDLAHTIKILQDKGKDSFYEGSIAKAIVRTVQKGGCLQESDLKNYKVKKHKVINAHYKGYQIASMPPPSSGGIHIAQILNMLKNDSLASSGQNSAQTIHLVAEAMRRAYRDRASFLGDPEFFKIPTDKLLSKDYAKKLRLSINTKKAFQIPAHKKANFYPESDSTTHLSVVDKQGNAVSSTQTINYLFGSCVVAEGTGIVLNNEMDDFSSAPGLPNKYGLIGSDANKIEPYKTMLSSMSPSFVFSEKGKLFLVLGSPGGSRIITTNLQVMLNVLEHKMPLQKAVDAPRFHHQWLPNTLFVEKNSFSEKILEELKSKGHKITDFKSTMGNVQAILKNEDGSLEGASDRREIGTAEGI